MPDEMKSFVASGIRRWNEVVQKAGLEKVK
jgi:tripartite-type tricarboxylate transporter receptor subunit TctC